MSVTLDYSSNTVVLKDPAYPENNPEPPRQNLGRSDGGAHFVFIEGDEAKQVVLNFRRLTQTEKDNLDTWIKDQVNYMEQKWTYTDPHSTNHTNLRFISFGRMFYRDRDSNLWNIDLVAEEDEGL